MFINSSFDLSSAQRIVFFDIDQTLSDSLRHCMISDYTYARFVDGFRAKGYKSINPADAIYLNQTAMELFAELFKIEGTYGICISAWAGKNGALEEIDRYFNEYADFPKGWLIGGSGGGGGDRHSYVIRPFIESTKYQGDIVALDDGAHQYSTNDIAVEVDGRVGFTIYDFVKALDILNIQEIAHNELLNSHVQHIRRKRIESA